MTHLTRSEAIDLLSSEGSRLEVVNETIRGVTYRVPDGAIRNLHDLYAVNAADDETPPTIDPDYGLTPAPEHPGMLMTFPLFHISGLIVQLLNSFLSKRKLVMMKKWNPELALELIEREQLTGFDGYWNRPEATVDVLRDGWFRTGDLGYLDEEGFLFITGRAKNIVIRGGENIGCYEVEEVLYEHPAVFEAVVFGLPDERLGEILGATVMVAPGQTSNEAELKQYAGSRLAKFKVPAVIWLQTNHLPRIASGKVDIVRLQKEAESSM